MVSGGPSFFRMEQDVVSDVAFGEQGGTFATVVAQPDGRDAQAEPDRLQRRRWTRTYIVWQNDSIRVGAGGFVRFTQADMNIEMLNSSQPTKAGGVQFGFGARLRF